MRIPTPKLFIIVFVFFTVSSSQEYFTPNVDQSLKFEKRILGFFVPDSTYGRLDVYIKLFSNTFHFEKKGTKFNSSAEISILIINSDKSIYTEKIWIEQFNVDTYDETFKTNLGQVIQRTFSVPLANYSVKISVKDLSTKTISTEEILFNDFTLGRNEYLGISSILLLNNIIRTNSRTSLTPNLSNIIGEGKDTLKIFYELYNFVPKINDSLLVSYQIISSSSDTIYSKSKKYLSRTNLQLIESFEITKIPLGKSKLKITASSLRNLKENISNSLEIISRIGNGLIEITDIEMAIQQTKYIATDAEYEEMVFAKSKDDKKNLFDKFWKKRDKLPATEINEYFLEYYQRIEYSNKIFSHFTEGWRTDMGMAFILLGPPNNIERHPFEINTKPFEVWSYYIYNRQLIFIDQSGFGDYRLTTPIWDLIQRISK